MKKNLQTSFSTRQYMLSKDFEIYYYNDRYFSGVSSHTHSYYEFYVFLEGNVTLHIDGKPHRLTPGDIILIPPNVPHYAEQTETSIPYRRFVFWLSQEYCSQLTALSTDYIYIMQRAATLRRYIFHYDIFAFHALQSKVFRLIEEINSEHFGKSSQISLCVNDLILHLNRTVYEHEHPKTEKEELSLYQNLLEYIERHLDEELTLDILAGEFFVSKFHIAHVFKENLGISVHQYILKKRLDICRTAIMGNTNINEACLSCGFKDYSNFFRAFKKEYGMSPKEYKEMFSQNKTD